VLIAFKETPEKEHTQQWDCCEFIEKNHTNKYLMCGARIIKQPKQVGDSYKHKQKMENNERK